MKRVAGLLGKLRFGWQQAQLLRLIILGFFKPSLASIVRERVKKQLRDNTVAREYRYPFPKRLALWSVSNPYKAFTLVAVVYGLAFLVPFVWGLRPVKLINDELPGARDFWTVNVAVLTVQAALVGLVFPLVIAFVGLLNQGRASFASRLTVYIESSAAEFVGVSSLLLCVVLSLQLFLATHIESASALITLMNLVWFAINISGLTYFVLKTIAFIHPERRTPITRAYVTNIVWPRELTATVTDNRWATSRATDISRKATSTISLPPAAGKLVPHIIHGAHMETPKSSGGCPERCASSTCVSPCLSRSSKGGWKRRASKVSPVCTISNSLCSPGATTRAIRCWPARQCLSLQSEDGASGGRFAFARDQRIMAP